MHSSLRWQKSPDGRSKRECYDKMEALQVESVPPSLPTVLPSPPPSLLFIPPPFFPPSLSPSYSILTATRAAILTLALASLVASASAAIALCMSWGRLTSLLQTGGREGGERRKKYIIINVGAHLTAYTEQSSQAGLSISMDHNQLPPQRESVMGLTDTRVIIIQTLCCA